MEYTNVKETFEKMPSVFDANKAKGINGVIQYVIEGADASNWQIEIKEGTCRVEEGTHGSPDVSITMNDETWLALVNNEMSGMQAFMGGKLKVTGNTGLAQMVSVIFPL